MTEEPTKPAREEALENLIRVTLAATRKRLPLLDARTADALRELALCSQCESLIACWAGEEPLVQIQPAEEEA